MLVSFFSSKEKVTEQPKCFLLALSQIDVCVRGESV